jgi:hypothetical protein
VRGYKAAAAVLCMAVLAGCSGGAADGSPTSAATDATEGQATGTDGAVPSSAAAAQPADLDQALATVSTTAVKPVGGDLEIGLVEAKVAGELLRIRLAYAPRFEIERTSVYDLAGSNDPSPYLVDPVNLKRHAVVSTGSGRLENNVVFTKGNHEQPIVMTYYFAAPPQDVQEMSLSFGGAPWPGFDFTVSR